MNSKKVGLIVTEDFNLYNFGANHPLNPLRLELTYSLMGKLGLLDHERLVRLKPRFATKEEIERVHSAEYVDIVKKLSDNPEDHSVKPFIYGLGPGDNPIFKGMYEASALVCGASLVAAETVWTNPDFNVVFNPAGGLHHAQKGKASGFCIFNDIAVAIKHLKTLKKDIKIAYLDIDCHHADGVQWLFYGDPNVLKISLHQSGKFLFPGTGDINECGSGDGVGYSVNFPLLPGTSNKMYLKLFRTCIPKLLEAYEPDILITQLGVDTHFNDPLTQMGLSIQAFKDLAQEIENYAVKYCKSKWLALGGGGYLMSVVPRAWTLFLAKMLDVELENEVPEAWYQEVKKKVTNEEAPNSLWDNNDKIDVKLLAQPEVAKKMYEYIDSLINVCEERYLPSISKK